MFNVEKLTVACVVAHPDDEVLLAGASLARHAAAGHDIHVLILASGLDSRGATDESAHQRLADQARSAAKLLGSENEPVFANFPDNAMDSLPLLEVVKVTEAFLAKVEPYVVYTHHRGDLNVDHRRTHDAVVTACRPVPESNTPRILAGEVLSSTEWQSPEMDAFQPVVFHKITKELEVKLEAMSVYVDELRESPHPRSLDGIRAQAKFRGVQSGNEAAEAFTLVREIV